MREAEEILRELRVTTAAPTRPPRPEDEPRSGPSWVPWAIGLLAGAIFLVVVGGAWQAAPRSRGLVAEPALDLRMTVERGGVAVRASPEVPLGVGERLFFRLAAERSTTAHLWVDGPAGREVIATMAVDSAPRDVGAEGGLTAYRVEHPGVYLFRASTEGIGVCHSCPTVRLEAR